jgi:ribulose-phosphate 3-epimerase
VIDTAAVTTSSSPDNDDPPPRTVLRLVIGIDGGTESIRAGCFDAVTGRVVGRSFAAAYTTSHPQAGWAEQNPMDWWQCCGAAVRGAVQSIGNNINNNDTATRSQPHTNNGNNHDTTGRVVYEICAVAMDTTCCSVVALDEQLEPLRPSLLWMDQRSALQAQRIVQLCRGDPALAVNHHGRGPVSAEWMTPKAMWLKEHEPHIWNAATTICEYQDYMNYKLTGVLCASACHAATRWHWDVGGTAAAARMDPFTTFPGRPMSLYQKLGIADLAHKLPAQCVPMGTTIGKLTPEAAQHLGLPSSIPVVQGGPDAFVGMIGLGCIQPGQLCLITGSSHLHCVVTSQPSFASGIWGAYRDAPLPGMNFAEGGQSSTGSILRWAKSLFGTSNDDNAALNYKILDAEAAKIPPGSDGLIALETFQGSRTPLTDPLARGALIGLTLSHSRGHIWRALMEAVCFGTRACIEGLANAGHKCDEIIMAGGVTRSDVWLQMHADISGKMVTICENSDAPLLGCAVLASVGVGIHKNVPDAVRAMVRVARSIQPDDSTAETYDEIYKVLYSKMFSAVQPIAHAIHNLRGVEVKQESDERSDAKQRFTNLSSNLEAKPIISPSLLACDWANIEQEVHRCLASGLHRLHIDIFDGVYLDSPNAFTFGPPMVLAIRKSVDSFQLKTGTTAIEPTLDLHMCVDRPSRFVDTMAKAGGNRFIFQFEAMNSIPAASTLTRHIIQSGMRCGVSINPSTSVKELYPLLQSQDIDVVDVLSVEPGFGGQQFQPNTISKVGALKRWREENRKSFEIMVDGGINDETSLDMINAGADVLVAGTFLFQNPEYGLEECIEVLKEKHRL